MATKEDVYEVLVPELTISRTIARSKHPVTGAEFVQNGKAKVYFEGEKVPRSVIADYMIDALENEDHPSHESASSKLRKSSGDPEQDLATRLGIPFPGYDDMSEDEVVAAMRSLPSATIKAIQRYETEVGDSREKIAGYIIGYGESPVARQTGDVTVVAEHQETDDSQAVAALQTREVEEGEVVVPGEGVTGTGDGIVKPKEDKPKGGARRSRRSRASGSKKKSGSAAKSKSKTEATQPESPESEESGDGDNSGDESGSEEKSE